jgi:SAM-dependent methyltransferase
MRPSDYKEFPIGAGVLQIVEDKVAPLHPEQHIHRRWEYSLACEALSHVYPTAQGRLRIADFGGGFGLLAPMMVLLGHDVTLFEIWDQGSREDLARRQLDAAKAKSVGSYTISNVPLGKLDPATDHSVYDASFCVSVIEHVPNEEEVFRDLCRTVVPGGLVFLTMDFAATDVDTFRHRGMRARIYDERGMEGLVYFAATEGLDLLGGDCDWSWQGAMVNQYSFASLALRKS